MKGIITMRTLSTILFICLLSLFLLGTVYAQWVQTNGPSDGNVACFAVAGTNMFAGTSGPYGGSVYLSSDIGTSWIKTDSGLTSTAVNAIAVFMTNLFIGTEGGGVYLSTNSGTYWTAVNTGLTRHTVISLIMKDFILFAGTTHGIFHTTDNGVNWTQTGLTSGRVNALTVSGTNLIAGTGLNGVYVSTNDGSSWTQTGVTGNWVYALSICGTKLFAGTDGGVYRSTDDGMNWSQAGLTSQTINSFVVTDTNLFAGTWGTVYLYSGNDTNWISVGDGLPNNEVHSLTVVGTNLIAGTWGSGVWRRPLSEMITSVARQSSIISNEFKLEQNYPNPFNPTTVINYQLPMQAYVTLKIFDVLGRELTSLVNKVEDAGYKSVTFDASKLPSGVYFYRLQAGSFVQTNKMLLMK
jgi:hypothetical protein